LCHFIPGGHGESKTPKRLEKLKIRKVWKKSLESLKSF